jgi:hypothetical protein
MWRKENSWPYWESSKKLVAILTALSRLPLQNEITTANLTYQ